MPVYDNISYPFRLASWKTANVVDSFLDAGKNDSGFLRGVFIVGLATVFGTIGAFNVSPDDTYIEGQAERISSYKEQIASINDYQLSNIDDLRSKWQLADIEDKDAIKVELDVAKRDSQEQIMKVLAGVHTEENVSEVEIEKILNFVETNMSPIDTIEMNGASMHDVGDAAFLNECQAQNKHSDLSEMDRAFEISECASINNYKETEKKAVGSFMLTILSVMSYGILGTVYGNNESSIRKYANKPKPQRNIKVSH